MVTKVGLQRDLTDAVKDLIELDYDAIEAYKAAIDNLSILQYKKKLEEFKDDHARHTRELTAYLKSIGEKAPEKGSMKSVLTKGKVVIANLFGDKQILSAMKSNEKDTNKAYERVNNDFDDIPEKLKPILQAGQEDEKKHLKYIQLAIEKLDT